jgi:ribosomal protein L12E/L44/L45/RPP1/RPP2
MKISRDSLAKEVREEINKYNESVKNGTATEDMASVLNRVCEKAGIEVDNKKVEEMALDLKSGSSDELIEMIDKRLAELEEK